MSPTRGGYRGRADLIAQAEIKRLRTENTQLKRKIDDVLDYVRDKLGGSSGVGDLATKVRHATKEAVNKRF